MKNPSLLFCFLFASLWACGTGGGSVKGPSDSGENFISFKLDSKERLYQGESTGSIAKSGSSIHKVLIKDAGKIVLELRGTTSSHGSDAIKIQVATGEKCILGKHYAFGPRSDTANYLEYFSGYENGEKWFYTVGEGYISFDRCDKKIASGSFAALVKLENGSETLTVSNGKFEIRF